MLVRFLDPLNLFQVGGWALFQNSHRHDMARHSMVRHGMARHVMAWDGMSCHAMTWHGMTWESMSCHAMACHGIIDNLHGFHSWVGMRTLDIDSGGFGYEVNIYVVGL